MSFISLTSLAFRNVKNTRIYPLRTSSNIWKIKLYSKHVCNEDCKLAYIEEPISDDSSIMFIVDNPDYNEENKSCNFIHTLNHSSVRIDQFDKNNPKTTDGDLLFVDQIVIPDKKINLEISFPIKTPKKILIETNEELGFSLRDIIYQIQQVYRWIYKREEETCSEKDYPIIKECECLRDDRKSVIIGKGKEKGKEEKEKGDICPICLEGKREEKEEKDIITECEHFFHVNCLTEWLDQKETCPTCRANLYKCECNGTYYIYTNYRCKIIPRELRGFIVNRNETDGIFQIYGHDKEDLVLRSMTYNSITKTLFLEVFG